ncbi:MAG: MltA domain-containing protein, partial [Planctomycetota bacterium]|nr:MltA domain-containing protein [Planctomycetota bacterium]
MRHTVLIALYALIFSGCQSPEKAPEEDLLGKYERPLPAGAPALRKVPPSQWPKVDTNFRRNPTDLVKAGKRSLAWFDKKSTTNHFPIEGISHAHAKASVERLLQLLRTSRSGEAFTRALRRDFDCYMSIGCDDEGTVLFTGYCSLELDARRQPSGAFRYPVYARPDALKTNRITGEVLGWQLEGQDLVPAPDRA